MKLSVIIVNYNVKAYLEQCLHTVREAMQGVDGDVYVVDNISSDGSVEMVRARFPEVKVIANTENVGFSRANNQAIRLSNAEYVVLLNPDTVVSEDLFRRTVAFMDADPKIGGLGVKMIDGTGRFLPESKRGLPTPSVAFYKIVGLTRLFPRSKVFGRYQLGHLSEDEAAPIEILSGACMFLRKKTLDEVGLLDENFFMYGEDIDLSYRITLGGYTNWYLPGEPIIHYKGESTKKSSVNYVFVFYDAMAIFARKHFARRGPHLFSGLIRVAIYLSAAGAILRRFLRRALLPGVDLLLFFTSLTWSRSYADHGVSMAYGLLLLVVFWAMGAYDVPLRLRNVVRGGVLAGAAIAIYMASLSGGPWQHWAEHGVWLAITMCVAGLGTRMLLRALGIKAYAPDTAGQRRVLAIGSPAEANAALDLLWQTHFGLDQRHILAPSELGDDPAKPIAAAIRKHRLHEVVFCAQDLPWATIIRTMAALRDTGAEFKISQPDAACIIGPSSIESIDDLLILEPSALNAPAAQRRKRLFDVSLALLFLFTLPIGLALVQERRGFIRNIFQVLRGKRTWVGYAGKGAGAVKLPPLRPGVISSEAVKSPSPLVAGRIDITYAKDHSIRTDLRAVRHQFSALGGAHG